MEEKKEFGEKLNDLFAGKGFYIVLLLCACLIAGSILLMAGGSRADVETGSMEITTQTAETAPAAKENDSAVAVMGPAAREETHTELPVHGPTVDGPELPARNEPEKAEAPRAEEPAPQAEMESVDYFIWPVNGRLLRGCGLEALSYDPTMRDWRLHAGWDISAAEGEQVLCTANGLVSAVYEDPMLGTVVEVRHSNGLVSVYANLSRESAVYPGQKVSVGSVLGSLGGTALGESGMESHLHFELRRGGENVDPGDWLPSPD